MKLATVQSPFSNIHTITEDNKPYPRYFLFVCLLYLIVSGILAVVVKWGIMDEDFHLESSKPFAQFGVNLTTLYNHVPPTGVSSHFWFAFWIWLFPSIDYVGLRLITCVVLALVVVFAYFHLKTRSVAAQRKVFAATLFMLAFPYFFLSVATVMTEGPSLIFLFVGLIFLSISRLQHLIPFFVGCLLLGITTIARFYFIPLLPALSIVLFLTDWEEYWQGGFKKGITHKVLMYGFIGLALLPLVGLIVLWGGLTPPAFDKWSKLRSGLSFNVLRPISALTLTGIYIAPIIWANVDLKSVLWWRMLRIVVPVTIALALLQVNLFHDSSSVNDVFSGPIEHSLGWLESKGTWALSIGMFGVYTLSLCTLVVLTQQIIRYIQQNGFSDKGWVFSLIVALFFVISQAFVGGNHPFFDRYLIHHWPFLGYVVVGLFPEFLNYRTYLVLAAYSVLSVLILIK